MGKKHPNKQYYSILLLQQKKKLQSFYDFGQSTCQLFSYEQTTIISNTGSERITIKKKKTKKEGNEEK